MKYYRIYSTLDRGEGARPRFLRGSSHLGGKTLSVAQRLAASERAKPYIVNVELVPCTRWGDPLNFSGFLK
jgi:hypothetical protein